jgi:hypothetical protein
MLYRGTTLSHRSFVFSRLVLRTPAELEVINIQFSEEEDDAQWDRDFIRPDLWKVTETGFKHRFSDSRFCSLLITPHCRDLFF